MTKETILTALDRKLRDMERQVRSIQKERIRVIRKMTLACPRCGLKFPVGRYTFVQVYTYERPHGCTGGDMHHACTSEKCDFICPECESVFHIMESERALAIAREWTIRGIYPSKLFPKLVEADLGYRGVISLRKPRERPYIN